jgi:hypothetical protein
MFIPLSILNDRFAGESILGLKLFSSSVWNTSLNALLAIKVSVQKCAVILMGLPLYVIYFSLLQPSIFFSVLCASCFNDKMCAEVLFWSSVFGVLEAFCNWMGNSFSRSGEFSVIILLNILYLWLACLILLHCPWISGLVFGLSHWFLSYSFHSFWVAWLRVLLFFFNSYFIFKLQGSVFYLF